MLLFCPGDADSMVVLAGVQDTADLQALFGLSGDEELMESFQCSLAQTYKCLHNTFSEPREVCACNLPFAPAGQPPLCNLCGATCPDTSLATPKQGNTWGEVCVRGI